MAAPLMVGFTPGITVDGGYTIRVTALDATTGNVVAGVNISSAFIIASDLTDTGLGTLPNQVQLIGGGEA